MIPGFRFLFVATMLTMSLVVFGLGAAALLRATHQQFASVPWRGPVETPLVRPPMPTLAVLRAPIEEPARPQIDVASTVSPAATEPAVTAPDMPSRPEPVRSDAAPSRENETLLATDLSIEPPPAANPVSDAAVDDRPPSPTEVAAAPMAATAGEIAAPPADVMPPAEGKSPAESVSSAAETAPPSIDQPIAVAAIAASEPIATPSPPAAAPPKVAKRKPIVRKKVARRAAPRARVAQQPAAQPAYPQGSFPQTSFQQPAFQQQASPFGNFR